VRAVRARARGERRVKRERIISLLVVLAVVALGVWTAYNSHWEYVPVRSPPRGEALTNRYYSLEHLLRDLGIQTREVRSLRDLPPDAALYVRDFQMDFAHRDLRSVEAWVEAGGRLIIPGLVLSLTPPLQQWSAVSPVVRERRTLQKSTLLLAPPPECSLWSVQTREASSESLCIGMTVAGAGYASHRIPLWSMSSEGHGMQVLRVAIDSGELTVIGPMAMLENEQLIQHDHARAFMAASGLKRGDTLLILGNPGSEPLLALLWRLAAPAVVVLGLAILALIVRHWPRFGPAEPAPTPIRRSLAEQIHAAGRFAWRTHRLAALRAAVGQALTERASRVIAGYATLNPSAQAEAIARLTGIDARTLSAALTVAAGSARRTQLGAIALLETARRALGSTVPQHRSSA